MSGEFSVHLSNLLEDLDALKWKRTSADEFSIPYKTLFGLLGRPDLVKALDRSNPSKSTKKAAKKLLRDSVETLRECLVQEEQGLRLQLLIPVLQFYARTAVARKGHKRGRPEEPEPMAIGDMPPVEEKGVVMAAAVAASSSKLPELKLVSVPGAHLCVRMSPAFSDGETMLTWLYEMLMSERRATLSDHQVGRWLLHAAGGGPHIAPHTVAKLLRLAVSCSNRPRFLVFDAMHFCHTTPALSRWCTSDMPRTRLVTLLTLQWSKLKDTDAFRGLSKDQLLFDVTGTHFDLTADEWCSLTGSDTAPAHVLVTTELLFRHVAPWLFMMPEWQLAFAVNALGLRYPGKRPRAPRNEKGSHATVMDVCQLLGLGLMHKRKVVVPCGDGGLCLCVLPGKMQSVRVLFLEGNGSGASGVWRCMLSTEEGMKVEGLLQESYLPTDVLAAQQFMRTKRAPPGLSFDDHGIFLTMLPHIRLEFRWYQLTPVTMDVEQLFRDAYQILIGSAGPRTLMPGNRKCDFGEVAEKLGLLGAMMRLVDVARRDHTYPDGVVPIFDMTYVPVYDQSAAFNIHRLTGRFAKHIVGFRNNSYDVQFTLSDVCTVLRRTGLIDSNRLNVATIEANPWITPGMERYFSPKDICLLLATTFVTVDTCHPVVRPMLTSVKVHLRRTDVEDLDNTVTLPRISVADLYAIASESHVMDARDAVCRWLEHHRVTEAPFFVYDAGTSELDDERTHAVLCGTVEGETLWFDGHQPRALMVSVDQRSYRGWIRQQSRNREHLVPRVPCPIRIRYSGEKAVLVTFDVDGDRWMVWNGAVVEMSRNDFDLLDQSRCLPCKVVVVDGSGDSDEEGAINTTGIALQDEGDGVFWVELSSGARRKMVLGQDFEWATSTLHEMIELRPEDDEGPQLIPELFTEEGEKRYRVINSDMPLPGPMCQDWVMKEFFSEDGKYAISHFLRWMELKVSTRVLYEAFYAVQPGDGQPLNESWAQRSAQQLVDSCRWIWTRLQSTHEEHFKVSNYQRMVWFTKMQGHSHCEETFLWLMQKLYDL